MIPITDRHLWEACGLAMEQDIADFTAQSCSHRFSEDFHESIEQMQEKLGKKRAAKAFLPRIRPFWRFLPAAAVIALVCLAGFRLLDLAPFRMGSTGPDYSEQAREAAEPEDAAGGEDTGEYIMDAETAEAAGEAAPDSEEMPGGAAAEAAVGEEAGQPDTPTEEKIVREGNDTKKDGGAMPESEQSQTGSSTDSSASQKENDREDNDFTEEGILAANIKLVSVTYYASSHTLELELRNDSNETIDLENNWILFNADGDTVNIEEAASGLSVPSRLYPQKTATLRCILPYGDVPEGEYTLELEDGEIILNFSFP